MHIGETVQLRLQPLGGAGQDGACFVAGRRSAALPLVAGRLQYAVRAGDVAGAAAVGGGLQYVCELRDEAGNVRRTLGNVSVVAAIEPGGNDTAAVAALPMLDTIRPLLLAPSPTDVAAALAVHAAAAKDAAAVAAAAASAAAADARDGGGADNARAASAAKATAAAAANAANAAAAAAAAAAIATSTHHAFPVVTRVPDPDAPVGAALLHISSGGVVSRAGRHGVNASASADAGGESWQQHAAGARAFEAVRSDDGHAIFASSIPAGIGSTVLLLLRGSERGIVGECDVNARLGVRLQPWHRGHASGGAALLYYLRFTIADGDGDILGAAAADDVGGQAGNTSTVATMGPAGERLGAGALWSLENVALRCRVRDTAGNWGDAAAAADDGGGSGGGGNAPSAAAAPLVRLALRAPPSFEVDATPPRPLGATLVSASERPAREGSVLTVELLLPASPWEATRVATAQATDSEPVYQQPGEDVESSVIVGRRGCYVNGELVLPAGALLGAAGPAAWIRVASPSGAATGAGAAAASPGSALPVRSPPRAAPLAAASVPARPYRLTYVVGRNMASWGAGQLRLDCDLADTNSANSFRFSGALTDGNDLSGQEVWTRG